MSARRAMTLLEVLLACAMLAVVASALAGLSSAIDVKAVSETETAITPDQNEHVQALRTADPARLSELLQAGQSLGEHEADRVNHMEHSPGSWVWVRSGDQLVIRWKPAESESVETDQPGSGGVP